MKMRYLLIIFVLLVVGFIVYVIAAGLNLATENEENNGNEPSAISEDITPIDSEIIPQNEKIRFTLKSGGTLSVNNFYKTAAGFDGHALVLHETADYQIIFDSETESFGIYFPNRTSNETKNAAENKLAQMLDVAPQELCLLTVSLSAPKGIEPNYVPGDYKLSSCR